MVNRNVVKVLSFRYMILAAIFILLAAGLVLLPKYQKHEGIVPEKLLSNAINPQRYISTDKLADVLINQDPSYLLIDVRSEDNFTKYSIPNSVNIPLAKLLDDDNKSYINQDQYNVVFISDDNFYADQAWMFGNRLGYKNLKVLKGGVNEWYSTIINPPVPTEEMPANDFELYNTRKAASMYFGVAYPDQVAKPVKVEPKKAAPTQVVPVKKKKKLPVEGGC
ncbi:MAG: rhodanese-like domain-containing protein [Flavobacteriaceae bacterium]